MAYKDNWLRHFFAGIAGNGGSTELARDFWSKEDIWNPAVPVRYRWLKTAWVCLASALAQLMLPLLAVFGLSSLMGKLASVDFILLVTGVITLLGTLGFFTIGAIGYVFAIRRMKQSRLDIAQSSDTVVDHSEPSQKKPALFLDPDQGNKPPSSETSSCMQEMSAPTSLVVHLPEPEASLGNARLETRDGRSVLVIKSTKAATCKRPN